jgi:hypothetical protein
MDKKGKFAGYFKGCLLQAIGYPLKAVSFWQAALSNKFKTISLSSPHHFKH